MRPYLQHYIAELQDRASLQAQSAIHFWLDRESSYKRMSQLALDLVASPAPQAYVERLFSLSGDLSLTARKWNILRYLVEKGISETEPSHSALNSMYCELKCAVSEMT